MRPVPYVSQLGNAPRNDCGPACVLMLTRWIRPDEQTTVAQISARYDPGDDGTTAANLATALLWLRLTPTRGTSARYPYIQLVDYLKLPAGNRYDSKARLHWIVRLSDTQYHDPYNIGARGANLAATKAVLDAAEVGATNRVGIQELPNMSRDEGKAREPYQRVYHVIHSSATEAEAVEIFRAAWRNNRQTVGGSYDDAGLGSGLQSKTAILHGIPATQQAAYRSFFSEWYPSTIVQFSGAPTPPTPDPPPVARSGMIGVHCISDVQAGIDAANMGCPIVTVMDNYGVARQLADRGVLVLFRKWVGYSHDGKQLAAKMLDAAGGKLHPAIIHLSFNECDFGLCYGTPEQIRIRAYHDSDYKNAMMAAGGKIGIGGFSMGTPDYTRQDICDAMREHYAPLYNDDNVAVPRVFLNYHSYSHNANDFLAKQGYDPIWLETRWQFALTKCGFRPDKRAIIGDETGEDEGSVGGFKAHNRSGEFVAQWCRKMREVSMRDIVVNGKTYPSPWVGATLFMWGNDPTWSGGYDCRPYAESIRQAMWV